MDDESAGGVEMAANGLMHTDVGGLMVLAHALPLVYPGAHWEQLCLGGWVEWGPQRLPLYPLLCSWSCHQGSRARPPGVKLAAECWHHT